MANYKNSNFKNLEWFQYIITRKFEEFYKQKKQNEKNKMWEIAIPIFSLIGTYSITMLTTKQNSLLQILIYTLVPFLFLFLCWISKIIVNCKLTKKIIQFFKKNKVYSLSTDELECKYKVKEFNNVVCNNLLLCYAFQDKFEENDNNHIKMYYYNEIHHYLMEAIDKVFTMTSTKFIEKIFIKDKSDDDKIKKIRIDRLENIIYMIDEIINFLDIEKGNLLQYYSMDMACNELESMKSNYDTIRDAYKQYIK